MSPSISRSVALRSARPSVRELLKRAGALVGIVLTLGFSGRTTQAQTSDPPSLASTSGHNKASLGEGVQPNGGMKGDPSNPCLGPPATGIEACQISGSTDVI